MFLWLIPHGLQRLALARSVLARFRSGRTSSETVPEECLELVEVLPRRLRDPCGRATSKRNTSS